MDSLLTDITSFRWWFSIVVVGILINMLSNFIQRRFDNQLSNVSNWWRIRSETKKAARKRDLDHIRGNQFEFAVTALDELRSRISAVHWYLFSALFLILSIFGRTTFAVEMQNEWAMRVLIESVTVLSLLIGGYSAFRGLRNGSEATYKHALLDELRSDLNRDDKPIG